MSNNAALLMLCFFFSSSYPPVFSRYCFIPLNPTCANFLSSCSPPTHLHPPPPFLCRPRSLNFSSLAGRWEISGIFISYYLQQWTNLSWKVKIKTKKKRKATSNCYQAQRSIQPVSCLRKHHGSVISFQNLVK